jgi:hypothetical protein
MHIADVFWVTTPQKPQSQHETIAFGTLARISRSLQIYYGTRKIASGQSTRAHALQSIASSVDSSTIRIWKVCMVVQRPPPVKYGSRTYIEMALQISQQFKPSLDAWQEP